MTNITSAKTYIQLEAAQFRSAVSEALLQIMGGSINQIFDSLAVNKVISTAGSITSFSNGASAGGPTITLNNCTGRPVLVGWIDDSSGNISGFNFNGSTSGYGDLVHYGASVLFWNQRLGAGGGGYGPPVASTWAIDFSGGTGNRAYQSYITTRNSTYMTLTYVKYFAMELPFDL